MLLLRACRRSGQQARAVARALHSSSKEWTVNPAGVGQPRRQSFKDDAQLMTPAPQRTWSPSASHVDRCSDRQAAGLGGRCCRLARGHLLNTPRGRPSPRAVNTRRAHRTPPAPVPRPLLQHRIVAELAKEKVNGMSPRNKKGAAGADAHGATAQVRGLRWASSARMGGHVLPHLQVLPSAAAGCGTALLAELQGGRTAPWAPWCPRCPSCPGPARQALTRPPAGPWPACCTMQPMSEREEKAWSARTSQLIRDRFAHSITGEPVIPTVGGTLGVWRRVRASAEPALGVAGPHRCHHTALDVWTGCAGMGCAPRW